MHLELWLWVNTEYSCGEAEQLNQALCKCDYTETASIKAVNVAPLFTQVTDCSQSLNVVRRGKTAWHFQTYTGEGHVQS